jgi:regulator of protease activity HflC (stomatin/prohibitin superfamily)
MSGVVSFPGLVVAAFILLLFVFNWINVLNEYERAVTFWLGRLGKQPKEPGLVLIFWPVERMVRISLRTVVHDVPSQDIITKDNVSVKVNAVVYFRVVDPQKAVVQVENYLTQLPSSRRRRCEASWARPPRTSAGASASST